MLTKYVIRNMEVLSEMELPIKPLKKPIRHYYNNTSGRV